MPPGGGQFRRTLDGRATVDSLGQVDIDDITEYVLAKTAFRETHFKTQILKILEAEDPPGLTVVRAKENRKRGSFPEGTVIRFP